MADSRGNSQALNFALPENRYIQPQQTEAIAPQEAVNPLPAQMGNDNFAYVEGITDKFYNLKGQVEKYALDMSKRYGVDVTQPDFTQPGGGVLFKTYQKLATDLMLTANDLKESQKINTQNLAAERSGQITRQAGFDPTQQLSSRTSPDEMFFTNNLLPEVEQANRLLATQTYTDADHNRISREVLQPTIDKINARTDISEQQKQFNINALVQQAKTTPYAAFQDRGRGSKSTIEIDILRDTTNLAQGVWPDGTYTTSTDDAGNPVLINKKREGEQWGQTDEGIPRVIDRWEKKADGVVELHFKPGKTKEGPVNIPPATVSNLRGDAVASPLISSNPKYGSVSKMYEAARDLNILDATSSARNELLVDPTITTTDLTTAKVAVDQAKAQLSALTSENKQDWISKNKAAISDTLPDGRTVKIYPHRVGNKWYIEVDGKEVETEDTQQEVIDFLGRNGYFKKTVQQAVSGAGVTTPVVNPGGKKAY